MAYTVLPAGGVFACFPASEMLHEITGNYPLVFTGWHDTGRPMSENTVNLALQAIGYKGRQTGDGFRQLLSTELNGRIYNRDSIEALQAGGSIISFKRKA